jgi:nucleoside-diphosphate-sugar epimerase
MTIRTAGGCTALVTGVSGHVGRALAGRLPAAGMLVRALVRTPGQAEPAARRGLEPRHGGLLDPGTLRDAVTGADVVRAAAYPGPDLVRAEAASVAGTRHLAEASPAAGAAPLVRVPAMSVHGSPQPCGLSGESPPGPDSGHACVATRARAGLALARISARGLTATVLRPGAICSPARSRRGDGLAGQLRARGWPGAWHPGDVIPWVHTGGLAEMTWPGATHPAAAGHACIAAGRRAAAGDYFGPIVSAPGGVIAPPGREPAISRCRTGRIHAELGRWPRRTFGHALRTLAGLAAVGTPALTR